MSDSMLSFAPNKQPVSITSPDSRYGDRRWETATPRHRLVDHLPIYGILQAAQDAVNRTEQYLEPEELQMAHEGVSAAARVLRSVTFFNMPWVGVTDEGVLIIQWQRNDHGVMLSFYGQDDFSVSVKGGLDQTYSGGYREVRLDFGLPDDIRRQIQNISREAVAAAA